MTQHDGFEALPQEEIAELETLLRSFRPREPNIELNEETAANAPVSAASRSTNVWTLVATWVSGAVVGAIVVSLINPDPPPQVRPDTNQDTARAVQADRSENHSDQRVEPTLPREIDTVTRLTDAATLPEWTLPEGRLAVGTHLARQQPSDKATETKPVSEKLELYSQDPIELNLPTRQPTTRHDLLREFRESPGSLL